MEISSNNIFNLWDTNGRRNDILNALNVYLNILKELLDEGLFDKWASFPKSMTQFYFYQKAIEKSPEIFQKHSKYDSFIEEVGLNKISKNELKKFALIINKDEKLHKLLDVAIESRARHYTSNLVKFGFATEKRTITPAGWAFMSGKVDRDPIEELLPLTDLNIILLRQLLKLKIFSKSKNDKRQFYSPFFFALYLLLENVPLNEDEFLYLVQGINPNSDLHSFSRSLRNKDFKKMLEDILNFKIDIPTIFMLPVKVSKMDFEKNIKNQKSGLTINIYYDFYSSLFDYVNNRSERNYLKFKNTYLKDKERIRKAFCLNKNLFNFGSYNNFEEQDFSRENNTNVFLTAKNFNAFFYEMYQKSKFIDGLSEYSDTTKRVLNACGLFKFKTKLELSNKELIAILFSGCDIFQKILGVVSEEEYKILETNENSYFGQNLSIAEILGYTEYEISLIYSLLSTKFKTTNKNSIKNLIKDYARNDFEKFIKENYPKERVINLLAMFSDRQNDSKIKAAVNDSATIPTIYEYIVGIAWYYISRCDFDLYHSFNLTLNADFGPEIHAGGGEGDIIVNYKNRSILIEATLMNKSAQKRGEWEPVLRHSLNNKAANFEKDVYTLFVADELDFNTINIWRAVAAVPLQSTVGEIKDVNGVIIMPFTNENMVAFLEKDIPSESILNEIRLSFAKVPKITEKNRHSQIIEKLI